MTNVDYLKKIVWKLSNPKNQSINMSLNNVHCSGMFSLVVDGTEFGKLLRIFIADKKLKPYAVQLHTHRYPICITAIKGNIKHYVAVKSNDVSASVVNISQYTYQSFLMGGKGLTYDYDTSVHISENTLPQGSSICMTPDEFHTISCSKNSMWIVEEMGFERDDSKVLGIPFTANSLYTKPEMFQINNKIQIVLKELRKIIKEYESIP